MATIESDVFPPEQSNVKQPPKVKHEPKISSGRTNRAKSETNGQQSVDVTKANGSQRQTMTGVKRKRASLALVDGQAQDVVGSVPTGSRQVQEGDPEPFHRAGPNIAETHPSQRGSQYVAHADAPFDIDFQPNGTLHPHLDIDPVPDHNAPQEAQQPLFFGTQDDADDERNARRSALMQQSQAEVDALNPEELAQMFGDDDPDITMDDVGEETCLGPTQHVEEDEAAEESGNRRSVSAIVNINESRLISGVSQYHALFDD